MNATKLRILLADDHRLMRRGLRTLLEGEQDMDIAGEADNGRDAVRLALELKPDVVIMDVTMPELNGVMATRRIRRDNPDAKVLALSMHPGGKVISEMLQAGASGYLVKSCALEELTDAVRSVQQGKVYLSPEIAGPVVDDYVQRLTSGQRVGASPLSDREREVLQLVAEGKSTKEIASDLHITPKTVEAHRQHIMDKLDIRSIAELTKYAIREGLTSVD